MNAKTHKRSSSYSRKGSVILAKTPRPVPRRGQSYSQAQSAGSGGSGRSISVKSHPEHSQYEEGEDDAMSLLQFCATCEKQISYPSTSVLYCSEACRQRDVSRPTPLPLKLSPAVSQISLPSHFEHHSTPDIIPRMSPTAPRPLSLTFSDLTLSSPPSPAEEAGCVDGPAYSSPACYGSNGMSDFTYYSLRTDRKGEDLTGTNAGTPTHRPKLRLSSASEDALSTPILSSQRPDWRDK